MESLPFLDTKITRKEEAHTDRYLHLIIHEGKVSLRPCIVQQKRNLREDLMKA